MANTTRVELSEINQVVSFRLGEEEYGAEINNVREIIRVLNITQVPQAPHFIEGVINLRGTVIPVINLRRRFGLPEIENDKNTRIVVVDVEGREIGIIVDAVAEVLRIPAEQITPPPAVVAGIGREYLLGVGQLENRLLVLLDLKKILSATNVSENDPNQIEVA